MDPTGRFGPAGFFVEAATDVALGGAVAGLGILAGGVLVAGALGAWDPTPIGPGGAPPSGGTCTPDGDGDGDDPDCKKASPWHLKQAGIKGEEHLFKQDHVGKKAPVAHWDICACEDGSIRLAEVGQCGTSGPKIPTWAVW